MQEKKKVGRPKKKDIVIDDNTPTQEIETTTGLGDVIENVTSFLGITKCEECEERRKKLNKMFPYTRTSKEISSEEDKEFIKNLPSKGTLKREDADRVIKLVNETFNLRAKFCNCPGLFKSYIEKLKVQVNYQDA